MTWLAEMCMLSFGWRRAVLLLAAGALAALSVPPLFVLPAFFVGFPVLVWCLDGAETPRKKWTVFGAPFRIGYAFGLGYFLVALHWIGVAFFVDGGIGLLLMPLAILALCAGLAIFWGLATAIAHKVWSHGPWRIFGLAAALTTAEFARGHLLTGFPFALPGYALTANEDMMQLAALCGVYGLTFLIFLLAGLPALIWPGDGRGLTRRLIPFFVVIAALAGQIGFGQARIAATEIIPRTDSRLRLIQPAIDQTVKWQTDSRDFIMDRLLTLSETRLGPNDKGLDGITHLVWPESAMPFYLSEEPEELARIARMLPLGKFLITGAPRLETGFDAPDKAFNSVLVIDTDGEITGLYDKTHLVPIGEYLPFADLLGRLGLKQFVPGSEGWAPGEGRRVIPLPGGPSFLPLICYEIIFSGDLGRAVSDADFILNLTNDGWFDRSIGIGQHFYHARLRAVEEGKAVIRVANTGITAMIDPLGRVTAAIAPGDVGVLDVVPPNAIAPPLFTRLRHWPLLLGLLVVFLGAGWNNRRASRRAEAVRTD